MWFMAIGEGPIGEGPMEEGTIEVGPMVGDAAWDGVTLGFTSSCVTSLPVLSDDARPESLSVSCAREDARGAGGW